MRNELIDSSNVKKFPTLGKTFNDLHFECLVEDLKYKKIK